MSSRNLFLVFLFSMSISVFFTNCANESSSSPFGQSAQSVLDEDCTLFSDCENDVSKSVSASYIEIQIYNDDPTYVPDTSNAVTVTGGCNAGGFQSNRIYWRMKDASGGELYTHLAFSDAAGICDRGRFRLDIPIAQGFNRMAIQVLEIEMVGLDENNAEYRSSLNSVKQLELLPY